MRKFIITSKMNNLHVVKASTLAFQGLKSADLYKALKHKDIRIDGRKISSDIAVTEGQEVEIWLPDSCFEGTGDTIIKTQSKLNDYKVVFETDGLLLVNKRQGLPVHGGKTTEDKTLIDIIRNDFNNSNIELCHRIDMNTGGLVLLAKDKQYLEDAIYLFSNELITKRYRTLCFGLPREGDNELSSDDSIMKALYAYLEKTPSGQVFIHDEKREGDLPIKTLYRVLRYYKDVGISELELELITGRMHQIRAQLAHIGNPILGDGNYGRNKDNLLHRKKDGSKLKYQQLFATSIIFGKIPSSNMHHLMSGRRFNIEPLYEVDTKSFGKEVIY